MSVNDSGSYQLVKTIVLRNYGLVPKAYRQHFRSHKKENSLTLSLGELILLEQFKNALPGCIVTYIQEREVSKVTDASGAAVSLRGGERYRAIAAVRAHTKPSSFESVVEDPGLDQELTGSTTDIGPVFKNL